MSSRRAVERPPAETSRTAMSGSGSRSKRASTRAVSAPWRTRPASARAPVTRPSASISRLLPAPVSPVITLSPGSRVSRSRSISARSVTVSSSRRPTSRILAGVHEGSSATLWRSRSQNGCAPSGSTRRIGPLEGADLDDVADRDRDVVAAIDRDERLVRVDHLAVDGLVRAHDDGPDGRQVRGDRRHDRGSG